MAISASAGAGKTYQLSHRYIRLLAAGIPPDRICALTFSRKAAGEIFDSIVTYLCEAAASEGKASHMAVEIGLPTHRQEDFLGVLRSFVSNLHRMHIATLDSFMIGIVKAFPAELGVPASFRVVDTDGAEAAELRNRILGRIFDYRQVGRDDQRAFLAAFKQATFGQEEKAFGERLDRFINDNRHYFLLLPAASAWGKGEKIWPDHTPWGGGDDCLAEASSRLITLLSEGDLPDRVTSKWREFAEAAPVYEAGEEWPGAITYMMPKLLPEVEAIRQGDAAIKLFTTVCRLDAEPCRLVLALMKHIIGADMESALQRTEGIHRILSLYETAYEQQMRRLGTLTFDDAQVLLTSANQYSGGARISRMAEEGRLYIDYRLDCSLDHWLLDEFQDTSDLQWSVLSNLADEILQDQSGQRTFFYVGDVKQAIYGWRGGNARLFNSILERYGKRIEERPLSESYRSCRPIIDTVNRVFADLANDCASGDTSLPEEAIQEWRRIWRDHRSAGTVAARPGYAALIEPHYDGETKPTTEDRYDVVAALLRQIQPVRRGIDVAILVRTNRAGQAIVDHVRSACPDLPIVHEGNATILDNPVVALLLSLIHLAAHPGDTFALRHLQMSPLLQTDEFRKCSGPNFATSLLADLHAHGFRHVLNHWGEVLKEGCRLSPFSCGRLEELLDAAAEFDATGSRDCNSFLHYVERHQVQEQATASAVRVMTIHQSKGLGFDVVILPELVGRKSMARESDLGFVMAHAPGADDPEWAMSMPKRLIAEHDPVLGQQVRRKDNAATFDSLCVLYVALTRAKTALYMVTSYPGRSSSLLNEAAFLKQRLAGGAKCTDGVSGTVAGSDAVCLYEEGKRDWFEHVEVVDSPEPLQEVRSIPSDFGERPSQRVRLQRIEPSAEKEIISSAARLFAGEVSNILRFGNAIHALFEAVEWSGSADTEALISAWRQESTEPPSVQEKVCDQFRQAMASPEVIAELSCPEGNPLLWREKNFEIVLDSRWVTGQFDRVTVIRDADGRPLSATILDYKSNRVNDDKQLAMTAEAYRSQLALYSRALSHILHVPDAAITRRLLFTRIGRVVEL